MATAPLVAPKPTSNFEIAKEGMTQAVIAEVRDLGIQKDTYNGQEKEVHKILLRWQLAELDAKNNNEPKRIYEKFTFSLHEKAKLRKRLVQIFKKEPPENFDFNKLVGVNRNVVIEHNLGKDGKTYANIGSILPLNAGQAKLEIVPIKQKEDKKPAGNVTTPSNAITPENPISDMDVPF
jgi:hypothetical protein